MTNTLDKIRFYWWEYVREGAESQAHIFELCESAKTESPEEGSFRMRSGSLRAAARNSDKVCEACIAEFRRLRAEGVRR